jgi:hypothetical protein
LPVLGSARIAARIRILVFAAAALGLVLVWGCWLIYGAKVGTSICEDYTGAGMSPLLSQWCAGNSWRGWLGSCLAIGAALLAAGAGLALATSEAAWLVPATLLSAVAVWVGFALPQEVAGAGVVTAPPNPPAAPPETYRQPPAASTPTTPSPLDRTVPSRLPSARPRGLAHDIIPAPLFACPRGTAPLESATGPGPTTNFDRVVVQRDPLGLCASFTSAEIATFALQQEESEVVSLTFTPRHSAQSTHTQNPRSFSIEVWAADQGRTYSLILRPPTGPAEIVTVGNLGLARGHLSILIEQPHLPSWILNRDSSWTARLT